MSIKPITITVAGVNGRLGTLIASELLQLPNVTIHGFCRSPEKVSATLKSNTTRFKLFSGSAESLSDVRKAVAGCYTVVCAYNAVMDPRFMVDAQKVLIEACDAEGVDRYVASDYSGYFPRLELGDLPPKDPQIEVFRYLRDGNQKGTIKVKGVHILVGAFPEAFHGYFFKPDDPKYWGTGKEPWNFTSYETTAKYTARVAADEEGPTGILKFCDYQTNMHDIAAAIGKSRGLGRPIPLSYQASMEEASKQVEAAKAVGAFFPNMLLFCHYWFQTSTFGLGKDLDNERYPEIKTISLEDAVAKFVDLKVPTLEEVIHANAHTENFSA